MAAMAGMAGMAGMAAMAAMDDDCSRIFDFPLTPSQIKKHVTGTNEQGKANGRQGVTQANKLQAFVQRPAGKHYYLVNAKS